MSGDPEPVVYVIDDDPSVLRALGRLLRSAGLHVETYALADAFLQAVRQEAPRCLVLDVHMPDQSGIDLQAHLKTAGILIPIVFITGYGEIPTTVRAMKAGAVDFLAKPVSDRDLLAAIHTAFERDCQTQQKARELQKITQRFATLTPREREVFQLVVDGLLNKQIAYQLSVTEKTIKVHRSRVMEKMGAASLAELVRMATQLRAERSR